MGFYGNITNTSRTQFQFDKIYPNRKEMEQNILTDGIYLNRYVLIEYDSNINLDNMKRVWIKSNGFHTSNNEDNSTLLKKGNVAIGELVYTAIASVADNVNPRDYTECIFYICTEFDTNNIAQFDQVVDGSNNTPLYTINYNIDVKTYGAGRGYDSTVWQKVFVDDNEKYVMIAELNTVVPTFDVTADAPTMNPVVPHFDTQSTDVYYKLHWQAPWGFRVAAASEATTTNGQSDTEVEWTSVTYDPETGIEKTDTEIKNGAIYFNKAGFDWQTRTYIKDLNEDDNYIKIVPTGVSGNKYNKHDGTANTIEKPDIQELTINLPAIGNMMSDAWDIIHGPNRDNARTDENGSLQGRLDSFTEMNVNAIPVKRSLDGTLVGSYINGNTNKEVNNVLSEELSESFDSDDAWIKTSINTIGLDNTTDLSGIAIHHTFHAAPDTSTTANKNDATGNGENRGQGDTLKLYAPIVDKAGHVVGKNTETVTLPYGFKTISVANESESTDGVTAAAGDVVADNTQDTLTLTPGNKWIHITANGDNDTVTVSHEVNSITTTEVAGTDLTIDTSASVTIPDWTYDEGGHIRSKQNHLYKLPFGYGKIKGDSGSTAATATYDELTFTSDEWLTATVDKDKVIYSHDYPKKIDDTTSESNVNGSGDTIVLETLERDDKGHVIKVNQNTVTLPFGYKAFKDSEPTPGQSVASSTQDTMTLKGDNWVKPIISNDLIAIEHVGPVDITPTKVNDVTPYFGGIFTITDWYFDDKGHKSSNNTHTVQIPLPSLTNGSGNVVIGLSLTPSTGAFTETKNNISNLLLTDYSKKTDNSDIAATDALGDALSKLQTQIHDTGVVINNLDYDEAANNTQIITQVTQTDGKITNVARAAAGTLVLGNEYNIAEQGATITPTDSLNTAFGKLEKSLVEEKARAEAAESQVLINAKAYADEVKNNLLGEGISETFDTLVEIQEWINGDGVNATELTDAIANESAAREELANSLGSAAMEDKESFAVASILEDTKFNYKSDEAETVEQKTIAELFTIVANLQAQVNALQIEVNRLSEYHPAEEETPVE